MSMTKHFAIMGAAMLALKRIDQEDPEVLMYTRLIFAGYVLVSLIINIALHLRVIAARDLGIIMVPAPPPSPFGPPAPAVTADGTPGDDEDATRDKPSTVLEYDLHLLQTARKSWLMNAVILTLVHMKTASVSPLLMSTIMGLTRYLDDPLFKLHMLGFRSDGPLKRPFPVDKNPLAGLLQGMLPEANPSTESNVSGPSLASRRDWIRRTQQHPPAYVEDLHEDDEDEDDEEDEHAPTVSLLEQDNPHDNDFDSDGPAADEPKKSK